MTDDLRTRIAAVIDREVDGFWEPLDVADAVIREFEKTSFCALPRKGNLAGCRVTTVAAVSAASKDFGDMSDSGDAK